MYFGYLKNIYTSNKSLNNTSYKNHSYWNGFISLSEKISIFYKYILNSHIENLILITVKLVHLKKKKSNFSS